MKPSSPLRAGLTAARFLCFALAAAWPALARAQVGITGSALGPTPTELAARNSGFDRGLQSKSALGQLQELAGQRIDTSSPSRSPTVQRTPKPVRVPTLSTNQQMQVALTGMLLESVLSGLFQDDSAQRQAEAAAAAEAARIKAEQDAATAEAMRAHQRAVQIARAQQAQQYRADWDDREREASAQMEGVFGVASTGDTHTNFFGDSPGPDKDVLAAILGPTVGSEFAAGDEAPAVELPESTLGQAKTLATYFAPDVRGMVVEDLGQGMLESTLWGFAENVPGHAYVKALSDFDSDRRDMTEALRDPTESLAQLALGGDNTVRALALPGYGDSEFVENYWQELARRSRRMVIEAWKLAYGRVTGQAEAPGLQQLGVFDDGN
jgi:hypothetical protein